MCECVYVCIRYVWMVFITNYERQLTKSPTMFPCSHAPVPSCRLPLCSHAPPPPLLCSPPFLLLLCSPMTPNVCKTCRIYRYFFIFAVNLYENFDYTPPYLTYMDGSGKVIFSSLLCGEFCLNPLHFQVEPLNVKCTTKQCI